MSLSHFQPTMNKTCLVMILAESFHSFPFLLLHMFLPTRSSSVVEKNPKYLWRSDPATRSTAWIAAVHEIAILFALTMKVNFRFRAPGTPPETGASTYFAPGVCFSRISFSSCPKNAKHGQKNCSGLHHRHFQKPSTSRSEELLTASSFATAGSIVDESMKRDRS